MSKFSVMAESQQFKPGVAVKTAKQALMKIPSKKKSYPNIIQMKPQSCISPLIKH